MAAGKPIVSTPIKDVAEPLRRDIVYLGGRLRNSSLPVSARYNPLPRNAWLAGN